MPTPSEYRDQYRNLQVAFDDGTVTATIERYHLGGPDDEKDRLLQAVKEYVQAQTRKDPGFTLDLIVAGQPVTTTYREIAVHAAAPFSGKGSPEDCQIAAQLAVIAGRTNRDNLPQYCDDHMGLDCNGFVGNYFFHVRNPAGKTWQSRARDGVDLGPTSLMNQFVAAGTPVKSVDDINPANIHLFVEGNQALN